MVRRCAHRIWGLTGASADSARTQLAAERPLYTHAPIIFSGRKLGLYQHSTTAQRSILEHVSICSPSIRSPAWETAPVSVRVIAPSVSLMAERPFRLQGTHAISILFRSQFTIDVRLHDPHRLFFFGSKLERNHTWETSLAFFLYLPPRIGLLLTVRSRFFCTRYRV